MAMDMNKALRGSISQILLNALISGDKYGYEICKDIEQKSNGKLILKQPSLYSSLRRMENQGLITSYWEESDLGGRRHYYSITEKGKSHYEKKQVNWNDFGDIINALPSNETEQEPKEEIVENVSGEQVSDFGVVKQEDLFSLGIKKIDDKTQVTEGGETFIQFDMFDQKPNFIKTTNPETVDVFTTFKSKYSQISTNTIEGEESSAPTQKSDNDDIFQEEIIDIDTAELAVIDETYEQTEIEETTAPAEDKTTGYDAVYLSPEDTIESVYGSNNKEKEKQESAPAITDSSNNYKKSNEFFETNSFIDKQRAEKYESNSGKFAYTKDSDNIYGSDFSSVEAESLKGSLESFLNDEEETEIDSVIDTADDFVNLLDEDPVKKPTIEEVIPQPKAFDEYDEVLKDDERIDFPHNENYNRPDEYNPINYTDEEMGVFIQKPEKQEERNYKDKLANLYSDTSKLNPYNKPLEEERVTLDSEEIFESQSNEPISYENTLSSLQENFGKEGIKLRLYNKEKYTRKKQANYVNLSAITLTQGWLVWLFMALEIVLVGLLLNANQLLPIAQIPLYHWAFGLSFIYPAYYTIAYFIDPFRKIVSTFKLNISLFNKFLAMLINVVFIFAVNLFFGMTALNQLSYLSYWLLPIVLTTNYIISTLIYFILLKSKRFTI